MGTSITSGRWVADKTNRILYRDKSVTATVTDSVLTLYSDLQDHFDQPDQMDDTVPMTAQTPTEFTIGGTDAVTPWFMSPVDARYLTGGAIQTANWTRTPTTENGIVEVLYDLTIDPVASDIGLPVIDETASATGTLLGFDDVGGKLWIRPTDDTTTHNWDSATGNLDVTGGTQNVGAMTADRTTGEFLWANPNSVGVFSVQTGTRAFVYQAGSKLGSGTDSWPAGIGLNADGEFDILLLVKEFDVEIDGAVALFFARRGGALGDWFESDFTNGGRVTIPLTGNPNTVNDSVGHHNAAWTAGSGATLLVGEIVDLDSNSERAAIVANVTTPSAATGDFDYFLIRNLVQFSNADDVTSVTSGKTMTITTPTDLTPVTDTGVTFSHAALTRDILNGFGAAPYSIDIGNTGQVSWERVYQRGQYITRRGATTQIDAINGESYRGSTLQLEYDNQSGDFAEGLIVTGQTSGATGLIVADHDDGGDGDLILRAVRGTFQDNEILNDSSTGVADIIASGGIRVIPTLKFAPLGNMAGTLFQGAPGMVPVLAEIAVGREQDYTLIDDDGTVQNPPNTVTVEATAVAVDDWVSIFRLDQPLSAGGVIDKDEYTSHNTNNLDGDITFDTTGSVSQEAPPSGWIRVIDTSADNVEHRYHYASVSGAIFTLTTQTDWHNDSPLTTPTDALGLTVTDSLATFQADGVLPGMMFRNITDSSYGFVQSVTSETELILEPINLVAPVIGSGLTGGTDNELTIGDFWAINELIQTYDNTDNIYIPFLDDKAVATSVSTTIIQTTDIDVVVRVRQGRVILPFQVGGTIGSSGISQAAIRALDTIAN